MSVSPWLSLANPGLKDFKPYPAGKSIDALKRELNVSEIIKLASNENPLGMSEHARQAAAKALADGQRYPESSSHELKQALADYHNCTPDCLAIGNGSDSLIDLLGRAFLNSKCSAVFSEYGFAAYPLITQLCHAKAIVVPAKGWAHDPVALAAAVQPHTRLLFLANPNNPTGTWFSHQALQTLLDHVPSTVLVVLDEAYYDYIDEADYPNSEALLPRFANLVILRTFSKVYGLAGLRIGYSLSHPDIADIFNRVRTPFNVSAVAQAAACAALQDQAFVERSVAMNREGMSQMTAGLTELGFDFIPSLGNFITFNASARTDKPASALFDALLQQGIIVRPLANYGLSQHLRVSIGLPEENARFLAAVSNML